jgi:hypothetical protein
MKFSILALGLERDSHIKPDNEAGGLIWVEGWYQGRYGQFHVMICVSHILHWPFPSIDFYIAKKKLCSTCKYVCFESGLKNIPNNVDLYNEVRYCKIYPRHWHLKNGNSYSTWRIHLSQLFRFKLLKLYSNMLKCVNLIEIRFYAYLYASSFFVLWQVIFEITAHMPEVEFEGKYGYLPSCK